MFLACDTGPAEGPALFDPATGRWWAHGELHAEVARLAAAFATPGPELAFLFCRNDLATVLGYLACVEARRAVLLLDARLPPVLAAELDARYAPDLVLWTGACPLTAMEAAPTLRGVAPLRAARRPRPGVAPHPDLAVLLSTSGTTGSPKLVRLSRRAVEANAVSIRTALGIVPGDRAPATLPFHYSYGLSVLNSHLAAGAAVVLGDDGPLDAAFWDRFRACGCTSFAGVPYTYQMLERLGFDRLELPTLRTMTQAGGCLAPASVRRFDALLRARGGRLFVMYGQTEATARIAIAPAGELHRKIGSAGRAIPGGTLQIDAGEGPTAAPGIEGEVVYAGPNVMMGYAMSRADLARGDDLGGVLRTGDLGSLDDEGWLWLTGRARRVAKLFGLRVNLDEIESALRADGAAAVVAGGEDRVVAYCEYGDPVAHAQLARELGRRFRLSHRAFELRRVDALPLTGSGKIDYARLQREAG
jgi:acyl-coenzyme A synthetase/AMP-(fatty) acid ligase